MAFFLRRKAMEVDPVCGMQVDPKKAAATYDYQGKTYYFCSPGCRVSFQKDPEKYLKGGPQPMGHH